MSKLIPVKEQTRKCRGTTCVKYVAEKRSYTLPGRNQDQTTQQHLYTVLDTRALLHLESKSLEYRRDGGPHFV
ncbi:MAG: hypothetical protein ACFFED_14395 [Candidatus Thorarchaeota archaeon]